MSMQDESIEEQSTSNEPLQEADEAIEAQQQESSEPEEVASVTAEDSIPEKFVGKSAAEIIQAYRELEKDRGRLASELGSTRKERESLEQRYREFERAISLNQSQQANQTRQPAADEELDPLSVLESKFDEDPKEAIKAALKMQQSKVEQEKRQQELEARRIEAEQWYTKQKTENQDYARRESLMQEAAKQFRDIIKDEHLNSVKVLQALDYLSKGMNVDFYEKQAVERAKKGGLSMREEKRKAQSESANSMSGDKSVSVADMTLEQMEKYFGIANK